MEADSVPVEGMVKATVLTQSFPSLCQNADRDRHTCLFSHSSSLHHLWNRCYVPREAPELSIDNECGNEGTLPALGRGMD